MIYKRKTSLGSEEEGKCPGCRLQVVHRDYTGERDGSEASDKVRILPRKAEGLDAGQISGFQHVSI